MFDFNASQNPVIENGKLVLVSDGGSRSIIGIRAVRQQIAELESKTDKRPSTIDRLALLRRAAALWDAQ